MKKNLLIVTLELINISLIIYLVRIFSPQFIEGYIPFQLFFFLTTVVTLTTIALFLPQWVLFINSHRKKHSIIASICIAIILLTIYTAYIFQLFGFSITFIDFSHILLRVLLLISVAIAILHVAFLIPHHRYTTTPIAIEVEKKYVYTYFALLFIVALFLRVYKLGDLSLWGDEGTVYIVVKNILLTGQPLLESGLLYGRDLLHLYITAIFSFLFGQNNEFGLRLPSAIAGALLIFPVFGILQSLLPKKYNGIAIYVVTIIAVHPWLVEHSRIARSYMLMTTLYAATLYYLIQLYKKKTFGTAIIVSFIGFLAIMSHQIAETILFPFFVVFLLVAYDILRRKALHTEWKTLLIFTIPQIVSLFGIFLHKYLFSLGYYFASDQYIEKSSLSAAQSILDKIPFSLVPSMENILFIQQVLPITMISITIYFFLYAAEFKKQSKLHTAFFSILVSLLLAITFSKTNVSINRSLLFLVPVFAGVNGIVLATAYDKMKYLPQNIQKSVLWFSICIIVLPFSYSLIAINTTYGDSIHPYYSVFEGFIFRQDHKTTYEYVNEHYKKGDVIVVIGVEKYGILYSDHKIDYRAWSSSNTLTIDTIGLYSTIPEIQKPKELRSIIDNNSRVWIVTNYSIFSNTSEAPRVNHISNGFKKILAEYENSIQYTSSDDSARVYLIK